MEQYKGYLDLLKGYLPMPILLLVLIDTALWKFHKAWHLPSPVLKNIGFYIIINICLFILLIIWDQYVKGKSKRKESKLIKPFKIKLEQNIVSVKWPIQTIEQYRKLEQSVFELLRELKGNRELIIILETKSKHITESKIIEWTDSVFKIITENKMINPEFNELNDKNILLIFTEAYVALRNIYECI
jgi:hypothetical protein